MPHQTYDVVIVGGGHNGLTAAAYLSREGLSVLLLERSGHLGGASVSAEAFPGMGARLSRYSYLVSLLPRQIVEDLDLRIMLRRRRYSSYTPQPGTERGLLIDHGDAAATRASFEGLGAGADIEAGTGCTRVPPVSRGPCGRPSPGRSPAAVTSTRWSATPRSPATSCSVRSVR